MYTVAEGILKRILNIEIHFFYGFFFVFRDYFRKSKQKIYSNFCVEKNTKLYTFAEVRKLEVFYYYFVIQALAEPVCLET